MSGKADLYEDSYSHYPMFTTERHRQQPQEIRARRYRWWQMYLLLVCFIVASSTVNSRTGRAWRPYISAEPQMCPKIREEEHPELIWDGLIPSAINQSISWCPCYNAKLKCARLKVPLDYLSVGGANATIALIKYPANVSHTDKEYRGPVLLNPGGPGGSGVDFIRGNGPSLQDVLGHEYDLISFDPRGIGRTEPQHVIFADDAEGAAWRVRTEADALPNTTADAVSRMHARYGVLSDLASKRTAQSSPYVGTTSVARDMLSITQTLGRPKIQYWGFSYGTVLGATFAAMFPDHIDKMIIDGVVDVNDYYRGTVYGSLVKTDEGWNMFLQSCIEAGPEGCALYRPSFAEIKARVGNIYDSLKRRPLAVTSSLPSSSSHEYGVVDYKYTHRLIFRFLYAPYGFKLSTPVQLASALYDAEQGNGTALWQLGKELEEKFSCECALPGLPVPPHFSTPDASQAVLCADADEKHSHDTVEDLEAYYDEVAKESEFFDVWPIRALCVGWKLRPVERFAGPFIGNTSFPILLVGNTADPVTPITNARIVHKGFKNSVLLTQNSAGHCSVAASSICTVRAIREYFREGILPAQGTVCDVESRMFSEQPGMSAYSTKEDRALMAAWEEFRQACATPRMPFGIV